MTSIRPADRKPLRKMPVAVLVTSKSGPRKWRARLQVDGQRVERWGETKTKAEEAILAWYHGTEERPPSSTTSSDTSSGPLGPATMNGLFDAYLDHLELHREDATYSRTESLIRVHLRDEFGDRPFPVARPDIQEYVNRLIKKNLPTTSVRRLLSAIQGAFTFAVNQDWIPKSPAAKIEAPRAQARVLAKESGRKRQPKLDIPEFEEVSHLLDANADDPLWAMLYAMFAVGPRVSEACAMSLDQIRVGASGRYEWLDIHKAIKRKRAVATRDGSQPAPGRIVMGPPKGEAYRELRLPPGDDLFRVMLAQARRMADARAAHPEWPKAWDGYLFRRPERGANGRGVPGMVYAPDQIPALFTAACKRAGFGDRGWTPHTARHYRASSLILSHHTIAEVGAALGDSSLRMLERTYLHVIQRVDSSKRREEVMSELRLPLSGVQSGVHAPAS